jgi:predicted metalloendopeptidase
MRGARAVRGCLKLNLGSCVAVAVALVGLAACHPSSSSSSSSGPAAPASAPATAPARPLATLNDLPLTGGLLLDAMDKSVDPCTDFYTYACGGWLKKTDIPPDQAQWGLADELAERNQEDEKQILEDDGAGKADPADPYAKQAGDYYAACMDVDTIEGAGAKPLADELAEVATVTDVASLASAIAHYQLEGVSVPFWLYPEQDQKDATRMIAGLDQGGLGLPDRDYYLSADPAMVKIRDAYKAHVARVLVLAGATAAEAATQADQVLTLETALAKVSMTKVDQRDPNKTYSPMDLKGLEALSPTLPWGDLLAAMGAPASGWPLDIKSTSFFKGVDALYASTPPAVWQAYLRFHVADEMAPTLSKAFLDEDFSMRQILQGTAADLPRWKRCVREVDRHFGMAPARSYVALRFGPDGKALAGAMVGDVEVAMKDDLAHLDWMDDATRAAGAAKLAMVADQIGYPDAWRNYDGLAIDRAAYARDHLAAEAFEEKRELGKIGKPVDRNVWDMTPPTVNAYYDDSLNQLVLPAGILQPPFFGRDLSLAVNFGATAASTAGHELSHGFDDEGRQYDGHGNLVDWWTQASADNYKSRAACVVQQYNSYQIAGVHLNGALELGENIADIGGVKLGHAAFESAMAARNPASQPASDGTGFTPDQEMFLADAQSWCEKRRDEYAREQVITDPHAPEQFRTNGPLADTPAFQAAFSCKDNSPMAPTNRCQVW